jgi:predicted ATPase/DNA-binding SARP family transcriptional activator
MVEVWRIELLGVLRARLRDHLIDRFPTQRTAALLAWLAYHADEPTARERLADLLWPRASAAAGRTSLRKALSSLRRLLEPPGVPAGAVIEADRLAVRLRATAIAVDALEFRRLAALALRERDEARRARLCDEALGHYGGELLPGHGEAWVVREREVLARLFREVATARASALERAGDLAGAIALLRRALAGDPLREDLQREVARLLAATGDVAGALRQLRDAEKLVRRELDAPPSAELRALATELERRVRKGEGRSVAPSAPEAAAPAGPTGGLVTLLLLEAGDAGRAHARSLAERHGGRLLGESDGAVVVELARPARGLEAARERWSGATALDLAAPGDLELARALLRAANSSQVLASERIAPHLGDALVDRGRFRLIAGSPAARVFELRAAGAPETPPPRAEPARAGWLPLRATRFFGREEELAELDLVLRPGGPRLVTITGPGGIGKTRLATEAAAAARARFPGGAWFVPLAEVDRAERFAEAVASALRAPSDSADDPLGAVAAMLANDPALLVLDNLEQLGAVGAKVVGQLLSRVNGSTCLVTSRERVGLEGEVERALGPLALPVPPKGRADVAEIAPAAGVLLFVDRARQTKPDFELTARNAGAIVTLCRRLDGLPLALELAAGRVLVLPPARMLERIDERLELLVSRRRDVPARHRTLRAAIEWSASLLPPELARVFASLSVFRSAFTLDAASVVHGEDVGPAIERLVECSLVVAEPGDGPPRFRLLETIRAFAAERLSEAERASVGRRHAEHFRDVAESMRASLHSERQAEVAEELEASHDDLRAAVAFCLGRDGDVIVGYRLAHALERFWNMRGHLREGRRLLDELLEREGAPAELRVRVLVGAGALAGNLGDVAAARARFEEAVVLLRAQDAPRELAAVLNNVGALAIFAGDREAAVAAIEESVALGRRCGPVSVLAPSLASLAQIAAWRGELARAEALLGESVELLRGVGDLFRLEHSLFELGRVARWRGDLDRADGLFVESLEACRQIGDERSLAYARIQRAEVALERGRADEALAWAGESRADLERLGDPVGAGSALSTLGQAELARGRPAEARAHLERSLALLGELDSPAATLDVVGRLGEHALRENDPERARRFFARGLEAVRASDERVYAPALLEGMAAARASDAHLAARLLGAAGALRERMDARGSPSDRARRDATEAAVRAAAGAAAFDRALRAGRGLSLEEAIALALG